MTKHQPWQNVAFDTSNATEITNVDVKKSVDSSPAVPALLAAFSPPGCCAVDRCRVRLPSFTVGRRSCNDLALSDAKVSGTHFRIFIGPNGLMIEDLGSTNGTYVNGLRIDAQIELFSGDILRIGNSIFVFEADADIALKTPPVNRYGMAGPFYTASIIDDLKEAVFDGRHMLIVGATGVGKELAARAIAAMMLESGKEAAVLEHNCAHYTSEEEADASLFGVGCGVFSQVNSRSGLIETAGDGLLFLDEADYFPPRIQKSLLRLIENGQYRRVGESKTRVSSALIVFASNKVEDPTFGLIHDLYPRLRTVSIPPLKERIADIPDIFCAILRSNLFGANINDDLYDHYLTAKHFELMCLAGAGLGEARPLDDNVRGLGDLAKRLTAKAVAGKDPASAVAEVFGGRFFKENERSIRTPAADMIPHREERVDVDKSYEIVESRIDSHYELNKELILRIFYDRECRVSPTVRMLKSHGLSCSRLHLSKFLRKWGVKV